MEPLRERLVERLERTFAERGVAEPSVATLRAAAGVSLRTLYRHFPSREEMVLAALEHRHSRYLSVLFDDLPAHGAIDAVLERVAAWMESEARLGCMFHNAVAASPQDPALEALRVQHQHEVAARMATAAGLEGQAGAFLVIHEGLIHAAAYDRERALAASKALVAALERTDRLTARM